MSEADEWNADAAAARALGELTEEPPAPSTPTSEPTDDVDGGDDSGSADDSGSSSTTLTLSSIFLPLFVAPERGPSAATFEQHGVDGGLALIVDGVTDYVLDLIGKDVGDSLGPAGKMSLGFSRLRAGAGAGASSGAGGSQEDDAGDGDAPAMPGVSGA